MAATKSAVPPAFKDLVRQAFAEQKGSSYIFESVDFEYRKFYQDDFVVSGLGGDIGRRVPIRGRYIHVVNNYIPFCNRVDNSGSVLLGSGLFYFLSFMNVNNTTPQNKVIPLYGRQLIEVPEEFNEFILVGTAPSNPGSATAVYQRSLSTPVELLITKSLYQGFDNTVMDSRFDTCFKIDIPTSAVTETLIFPLPVKGIKPEINILIPAAPVNPVSFTIRQVEPIATGNLAVEYTVVPGSFPYQETFTLYPYRRTVRVVVSFTYGGAAETGDIYTTMGYTP